MKAAVYKQYGAVDVLEIAEIEKPQPGRNEVLVAVHATTVNPKDTYVRRGRFKLISGFGFPKQTGCDFAGEVAALGAGVSGVRVGDAVYGHLDELVGRAAAEFVTVPERALARKPHNLDYPQAAAVSLVAQTALQALRDDGQLKSGQRVAINGASGGVGHMAVQIAKIYGAHVTAISSERNRDYCIKLGADEFIDYKETDIPALDTRFNLFFDVFGSQPYPAVKHLLVENGIHVTTIPGLRIILRQLWTQFFSSKKARLVVVKSRAEDLAILRDYIEGGRLHPVIDAVYPLAEISKAHAHQQTKHTQGKIIVTVP